MARPTRDMVLMNTAMLFSLRSTCNRAQVGAVLAREGRILSVGYNGPPSGMPHCGEQCFPLTKPCVQAVHAEANCIAFAAKHGIQTEGAELYCTHSPCQACAQLIINAGIVRVVYYHEYRDRAPADMLRQVGIVCAKSELQALPATSVFD